MNRLGILPSLLFVVLSPGCIDSDSNEGTQGVDGGSVADPCAGIVCDMPPAPQCADGSLLQVFAAPGQCDAGACTYPSALTHCALGCAVGVCVGDPCAGVTCDQPPGACYQPTGVCAGGQCTYPPDDGATCDDGEACTVADACLGGTCAGAPEVCDSPPANTCAEDGKLEVHSAIGVCQDGLCDYPVTVVDCPAGCDEGACLGDACAGVTCETPPTACHEAEGTCQAGDCSYAPADGKECDDSDPCTVEDVCAAGVCAGTARVCDEPPQAVCVDSMTLQVSISPGTCEGGECSYATEPVVCDDSCEDGACLGDPCAGIDCSVAPPPACNVEGTTLTTWAEPGTCEAGDCSFAPSETPCDHGCEAGACLPDPCVSVLCEVAPLPACDAEGTTLTTWAAPGTCEEGECSFASSETPCDHGCEDGACLPEPLPPPYEHVGDELCFPGNGGGYLYHVMSDPPLADTDGKLTIRHKGSNPYGPAAYTIDLEMAADSWQEVAETSFTSATWQEDVRTLSGDILNQAREAMGWLRFRHSNVYVGPSGNCVQLSLVYNCPACLQCPEGQEDLGIGCQPVDQPYDYLLLDHTWGECNASNLHDLVFPGTPEPAGDGTLSVEYWGCDGANLEIDLETSNAGWVDIMTESGSSSCSWMSASATVPKAYLDAALTDDHTLRFRFSVDDKCAAGMGCGTFSSPLPDECMRHAQLTYPQ